MHASVALLLAAVPLPQDAARRPDIVLVLADDLGFSDIGCYGSEIATPNLDRLAAHGLRFTQFYNTGRCCPTRASLLTGLYPHQAGIGHMTTDRGHDGYRGELNDRCVTLAEVLRPAGYTTAMCGKWHVTRAVGKDGPDDNWPQRRGFDSFFGTLAGAGSYYAPSTLLADGEPVGDFPDDFYYTDALSDRAAAIVRAQPAGKPLFLYVAYTAPHWPLHAPAADVARCRGRYATGWDALRAARHARQIELGIVDPDWPLTPRDARVPEWAAAEHQSWQARRMEVYAAQVEAMDRGIGRIVEALRDRDRLDDTLFLFLADNGACAEEITAQWQNPTIPRQAPGGRPLHKGNDPAVMPGPDDTFASYGLAWANAGNTPFRSYKHWVHEGGIASPLVVHWPDGIAERGALRHEPAHVIDVMPTCVAVAGAGYPTARAGRPVQPMEGRSLLPVLAGETLPPRALFFEHEGNRAVRRGRMKLVADGKAGPWELYDLERDRTELVDLAAARPELVAELAAIWQAWAERANVLPLDPQPSPSTLRRFELRHGDALPRSRAPDVGGHAFTFQIRARIEGDGVLVAHGGSQRGWAVYVQDGLLHFVVRAAGQLADACSATPLAHGEVALQGELRADGRLQVRAGEAVLAESKAAGPLPAQPGEGLEVGRDEGTAVGAYRAPFALQGRVESVVIER